MKELICHTPKKKKKHKNLNRDNSSSRGESHSESRINDIAIIPLSIGNKKKHKSRNLKKTSEQNETIAISNSSISSEPKLYRKKKRHKLMMDIVDYQKLTSEDEMYIPSTDNSRRNDTADFPVLIGHKNHKKKHKHGNDQDIGKNLNRDMGECYSESKKCKKQKHSGIADTSQKKLPGKQKEHKHVLLSTSYVGDSHSISVSGKESRDDTSLFLKHQKKKKKHLGLGLAGNPDELSSLSSDGAVIQTISKKRKKRTHREMDLDESATHPKEVVVTKTCEKSSFSDSVSGDRKERKKRKRDKDSSCEQTGVSELSDVPQKKKKGHKEAKATSRKHKHKKNVVISGSGLSDCHEANNDDDDSPPNKKKRRKEIGADSRRKHKKKVVISRSLECKTVPGETTVADELTTNELGDEMVPSNGVGRVSMTDTEPTIIRNLRHGVPLLPIEESVAKLGLVMRTTINFGYWRQIRDLLDEKHIPYRMGRWTAWEDKILIENWEQLAKDMPHKDLVEDVLYTKQGKARKEKMRFIQETRFYPRMFKNISRLGCHIYARTKAFFDPRHHSLDLSERENEILYEFRERHGNKFSMIGKEMGFARTALNSYVLKKESRAVNFSPFTEEEDEAIVKGVQSVMGRKDVRGTYHHIPWKQILKDGSILTRNQRSPSQLRKRWLDHLCWAVTNPGKKRRKRKPWSPENQVKLITLIYKSDALEEHEIDFDSMMDEFEGIPSPFTLHDYWSQLRCLVPDWTWKQFSEIIEYLFDVYIPKLEVNDNLIPIEEDGFDEEDIESDKDIGE